MLVFMASIVTMAWLISINMTFTIAIYDGFDSHNGYNDYYKLPLLKKLAKI